MDKNAIKKYAVWAREELIEKVTARAVKYEIVKDKELNPSLDSINGEVLSESEKNERKALIKKINEAGYDQVMEEVAYTWFNRFIALRFMEVNGYLPSHVRVFSDENGAFKPQIMTEALHLEIEGLDLDKVIELKSNNNDDELFKYLLITQCNSLSTALPRMFQKISDYTELLLPDYLLREGSVIEQMIAMIPEEAWTDQVQIIGWLYQFYITEQNEMVYNGSYAREKIKKELVPAATTIYTPDWAVRYMVENSLGKLWKDGHEDISTDGYWKYYITGFDHNEEKSSLHEEYSAIKPEQIKVIDPCSGSGHILTYLFDVLLQIYEMSGYTTQEAVKSIIENNIYGLDIDGRAAQMAYFALMMKARKHDRRFFSRGIQPNVFSITESNHIDQFALDYFCNGDIDLKKDIDGIVQEFLDAKEYGSILTIGEHNWGKLNKRFEDIENDSHLARDIVLTDLKNLVQVAEVLFQKYNVVVTNPPYLGSSRFDSKLSDYTKKHYPEEKADLSMVMFKKALSSLCKENGFVAFITTSSWMYLSSFEKMREKLISNYEITSLVDFGTELFEGKVGHNPIVSWVVRNRKHRGDFVSIRLVDYCYARRDEKEKEYFNKNNWYRTHQDNLTVIPGMPVAYYASEEFIDNFRVGVSVDSISKFTGSQHKTADNDKYVRYWREIDFSKFSEKWVPYIKGGEFRRWYGNLDLVVDWSENALNFYSNNKTSNLLAESFRFKEGITYTSLSSAANGFRYLPPIGVFDIKGPSLVDVEHLYYVLAVFNTGIATQYFNAFNSTITLQVKDVKAFPVILDEETEKIVEPLSRENVMLSKEDWDNFENSWDFKMHPLVRLGRGTTIREAYDRWAKEAEERFNKVKENEEKINSAFISLYRFEGKISAEVDEKDVTIRKADKQRDVKSFISYAVGCMFGRYSLDVPGLIYAGGSWDEKKYSAYSPDKDGIIPICDDEYFSDDIVARFVEFVKTVFNKNDIEDNLTFIAEALGGKGSSRDVIRAYFNNEFYQNHCAECTVGVGGKRPFYWLFDSGKENGFKCLVYMHRYQPDTIARIRTDYVHEQQARYRTAIEEIENRIASAAGSDKVKLTKKLNTLKAQDDEIHAYEEKIHHLADQMISIDLDDGVKHNYEIFKDVLAKIK